MFINTFFSEKKCSFICILITKTMEYENSTLAPAASSEGPPLMEGFMNTLKKQFINISAISSQNIIDDLNDLGKWKEFKL